MAAQLAASWAAEKAELKAAKWADAKEQHLAVSRVASWVWQMAE